MASVHYEQPTSHDLQTRFVGSLKNLCSQVVHWSGRSIGHTLHPGLHGTLLSPMYTIPSANFEHDSGSVHSRHPYLHFLHCPVVVLIKSPLSHSRHKFGLVSEHLRHPGPHGAHLVWLTKEKPLLHW